MTPFFRKIRRRLLSDNRLGKYILYAAGEILLVVIGIIIALYLDDLRGKQQDRIQERAYLGRLQEELVLNLEELDRVIGETDTVLIRIDSLLRMGVGEIPNVENREFSRLTVQIMNYTIFQSSEATIEDILGSGQLDLIEDPVIRESIATWESKFIAIRSLEGDAKEMYNKMLEYYRLNVPVFKSISDMDFLTPELQADLLSDMVFLNTVNMMSFPAQWLNHEYRARRRDLQAMLTLVTREIDQREN